MRAVLTCLLYVLVLSLVLPESASADGSAAPIGYYRQPDLYGDTIVFVAEGDLWTADLREALGDGAIGRRLTSHPGAESRPTISPDGRSLAFRATYEGTGDVYVMPLTGGSPSRLTWSDARPVGWSDRGVLVATDHYQPLSDDQLSTIDPITLAVERWPLAQASDGALLADDSLAFVRHGFQGSHAKRYRGGTAQQIWRFDGAGEAVGLTTTYPGTSFQPMRWRDRLTFLSDRDGTMNLWSMRPEPETDPAADLRQHTDHVGWDIEEAAIDGDRVIYRLGADLRLVDLSTGDDRPLTIRLASDLDHRRERWIDEPMRWLTDVRVSPNGDRVVLTARGEVFVAPVGAGRRVHVTRAPDVRYRAARFLDDERLLVLSDEDGEVEWWTLPSNGVSEEMPRRQLTDGGTTLRHGGEASPDGRWLVHNDHDKRLWLSDLETGDAWPIDVAGHWGFFDGPPAWSADSRWFAYAVDQANWMTRIVLVDVETRRATFVTSDRWRSSFPTFDPNGDWLYFLSDRHYESAVMSPWEDERHPAPHFPRQTKVYAVALRDGLRPPWLPADELHAEAPNADAESTTDDPGDVDHGADRDADAEPPATLVDREGLAERLVEVPVPPGEYRGLTATEHRLFWVTAGDDRFGPARIQSLRLAPTERGDEPDVDTVVHGVPFFVFEMSADRRHLLVRQQHRDRERLAVIEAPDDGPASTVGSETLAEQTVDLGDWTFPFDPREEWRQMFVDAWRLHRDYFWDGGMHGVDWLAMREKYTPLVDRVTDRAELSDLLAQMVSELSALHTAVRGGDRRDGPEDVRLAYLGADVERADAAGGYRITHIPRPDPERPELRSPVHAVGVDLVEGDVIVAIDGVPTLERPPGAALRQKAGRMVRLRVDRDGTPRDVLVEPISARRAAGLRLSAWEYERRQRVEAASDGRIGYVHLRAMGTRDIAQWAREFYPVHHLDGLIVDVRHNRGGNIDSWILGDLLRRPWSWWKQRVGPSDRNMQGAFGGHMVVLVDAWTASDGELFAEGFRRLGLGPVIGTRTWGGQIWLTASNHLVDRGIATAAETGVFGPEGEWLIEGHGVDPDHVVDNLPHATFHGGDAQLDAAISTLLDAIEREPPTTPSPPSYPDRSSPDNRPVETRHD